MAVQTQLQLHKFTFPITLVGVVCFFMFITNSSVHAVTHSWDLSAAFACNSLVGNCPPVDKIVGWLNTKAGDAVVLSIMCFIFVRHAFSATDFKQMLERLAYWGWVGIICVGTYLIVDEIAEKFCTPIPLTALPSLHDLRAIYQIPLHSSAYNSYPSGHGLAYSFFAIMAWRRRYTAMGWFIAAVGVCMLSMRVILGMHWLSDIFLGAFPLAILLSSVCLNTYVNRTYNIFYAFTNWLISKLSRHTWLFQLLAPNPSMLKSYNAPQMVAPELSPNKLEKARELETSIKS